MQMFICMCESVSQFAYFVNLLRRYKIMCSIWPGRVCFFHYTLSFTLNMCISVQTNWYNQAPAYYMHIILICCYINDSYLLKYWDKQANFTRYVTVLLQTWQYATQSIRYHSRGFTWSFKVTFSPEIRFRTQYCLYKFWRLSPVSHNSCPTLSLIGIKEAQSHLIS